MADWSTALSTNFYKLYEWYTINPTLWVHMNYERAIGNVVQYSYSSMRYISLAGGYGTKTSMAPGRYMPPKAILDNPVFYHVSTYTDFVVEPENPFEFVFPDGSVSFDKDVYNEGDVVFLNAFWYDPAGIVRGWKVTITGDETREFFSDADNSFVEEPISYKGISCDSAGLCTAQWAIPGIQHCLNATRDNKTCINYEWKLFNGGGEKKLTGTVTLYASSFSDGVSRSDTAVVLVTSKDFLSGFLWWHWLLIILLILFVILLMIRETGPRRG